MSVKKQLYNVSISIFYYILKSICDVQQVLVGLSLQGVDKM